jgi:hypothetical protein
MDTVPTSYHPRRNGHQLVHDGQPPLGQLAVGLCHLICLIEQLSTRGAVSSSAARLLHHHVESVGDALNLLAWQHHRTNATSPRDNHHVN